ncbi:MAG: hypothetical protein Tsb002_07250 [Wenzhouxiangellaceae bacterium]
MRQALFFVIILIQTTVTYAEAPPPLPQPLSNNPVAMRSTSAGQPATWMTLTGLGAGKSWRDLREDGYWWQAGMAAWQPLPPLSGNSGRLAAQLIVVAGEFWFFGGYTVAEDGAEVSTPDVIRVRPHSDSPYQAMPSMPVPVDDAVILGYQDRYIYLISGWHDVGNVNLVQVFDTQTHQWSQAEPWPGNAVFGHAGAIADNHLLVCGGVRIAYPATGNRQFLPNNECWQGIIRTDDPRRIDWRPAPAMPGGARYRSASAADGRWVVFAGGAHNPYNYDGIGYNGEPAQALPTVIGFDLDEQRWGCFTPSPRGSMDHRALIVMETHQAILIGGMTNDQQVSDQVLQWQLKQQQCD